MTVGGKLKKKKKRKKKPKSIWRIMTSLRTVFSEFMEDLHSALNARGLTVTILPEKGRSLFTTRNFRPGEEIISQEPYVCVPNNSPVEFRCDRCFASINLKKCSACKVAWYCSSMCQRSEWKLHRLECDALARLDKGRHKSVTPSIRLMIKLFIRRKLQSEKVIPMAATDNYKLVEELIDHMSGIDEKQLVLYAQMGTLVNLILQWPEMNVKEIAVNFSKLACNAHTICDSELRPLGTGLYPVISIINHSCLPNAVLVFEGRSAVVRAVQHIPPGAEAQEDEIKESAILEGYRCTNDQCAGFLLRNSDDTGFTCQQCGLVRSKEDIKNIASQIKSISDEASTSMSSQNYAEALFMHEKVEKLQKILCHPYSISLMQTREKLLKISMELENWTKALTYCKLTISVYQKLYPGIHPLLGLQFYTCGKLEWLLGHTEDSLKSYTKAFDILRITHGTNSSFMKELLQKLEEARAEASYKRSSIDDE
ncbi:histone-lysine N-methyltransferase ASHR1 isoform X6 [Cucumis melo]|uniref:Histone-lysine N-methyltransferase ASHR1 isoform X6 n=1 Tax=Cucumis melo TaxID=3656 RepID=A0ABM3L826_CUCME|nr:histone-lysine N-methyltransferase ASHR1 isoform X6 [Cucumis melo]